MPPAPVERIHLALTILPLFHVSLGKALPSAGVGSLTFTFDGLGWEREELRTRLADFELGAEISPSLRDGLNPSVLYLDVQLESGEPTALEILQLLRQVIAHLVEN
jgi:hypothetical protein